MDEKTDRELLEAAARAAGLRVIRSRLDDPMQRDMLIDLRPEFQPRGWNPLADDGDALRLAGTLRVRISIDDTHELTEVTWFPEFGIKRQSGCVVEKWGDDRDAATRRAIVRAAAAR